jgi:hypothetical protein
MTHNQWKRLLARFNPPLSQVRAAEMFGYTGRTGQRWASGELPVPKAIELLVRLMLEAECERPEELIGVVQSKVPRSPS